MEELSNRILAYYLGNFDHLPERNGFHFASRLYEWANLPESRALLDNLRPWFTGNENIDSLLTDFATQDHMTDVTEPLTAQRLREPYFAKYPKLIPYSRVLMRSFFLQRIYGIATRPYVAKLFSPAELRKQADDLLHDQSSLAMLSTYALNFLYVYERFYLKHEDTLPLEQFATTEAIYQLQDSEHRRLLTYFYAHCIIGETLFYFRSIPEDKHASYSTLLTKFEALLAEQYDDVSLDTKLEFLVCCRILAYTSPLEPRIYEECSRSVSPNGTFLIDTHNTFAHNPHKKSFAGSEHRNTLFLMSTMYRHTA